MVFHLCEAHATSHFDQLLNHGYLAVDFFFALSGFVIGYAYDDRWGRMTVGGFFKRRLIRLQPMVVLGMAVGAALFYFQDCDMWPVHAVPVWKMLAVMLVGMTLLPVPVSMDVRGWQEMHPLNGPGWSLFYEYCANILYALVVRRFPKWLLGVLVAVSGATLIRFALTSPSGDIIGGWSLTAEQLGVGFTRMMYPFFGGLLLSRLVRPGHVRRAFWWCSLGLVALLAVPRVGGTEHLWQNGLYDALVVVVLFPLIVWTGASGTVTGRSARVCEFLGDISYPIYITHYPLVYTYTAWVRNHGLTLGEAWPAAAGTVVVSVLLAYAALKWHAVQHEVQPFLQLIVNRELKVQSVLGGLGVQCAAVGALRGANVYMVAVIASQLFFVFGLQTVAANVGIRGIQAVLGIPALVQLLEPGLQLFIAAGADYAYIA